MTTPIALQAEIARLREAIANKHHETPESCPLWLDGCHCSEAFQYWKQRCKYAETEIANLTEENRVLKLKLQHRADTKPITSAKLAEAATLILDMSMALSSEDPRYQRAVDFVVAVNTKGAP